MASRKESIRKNSLQDDRNNLDLSQKPLKPLPGPSSVKHVFLIVGLHLCKKIIFFNIYLRILLYVTLLFTLSSIADVLAVPKIFFSSFNNVLNTYFVKLGWFWTLLNTIPFVFMTSYTYCCTRKYLLWKHFARLCIATFFWFFWVNLFSYIEGVYGNCERKDLKLKYLCVSNGYRWNGFDLSGHTFILIYSTLVIIEEARPILGWESIEDLLRDENYTRLNKLSTYGPLRNLDVTEFEKLKSSYKLFLPYIRLFFFIMTLFTILWDYMLISTILYFHSMPEKLLSGLIAILTWYATYEVCFKLKFLGLILPGDGIFIYFTKEEKSTKKRRVSLNIKSKTPMFMGYPLNIPNEET